MALRHHGSQLDCILSFSLRCLLMCNFMTSVLMSSHMHLVSRRFTNWASVATDLYVNLVMESFSAKGDNMVKLNYAADFMWERVEVHRKWLGKDLRKLPPEGKTIEGTPQILVDIAERLSFMSPKGV